MTAGAMVFGILFGWGVLYLTRYEGRNEDQAVKDE
jgi:hypothetical protein